MPSLAIIGSGISGLATAFFLRQRFDLTIFEAADYIGGHTHTVTVTEEGRAVPIDTGFMVFNHVTYPHLTRLFEVLGVPTKRTDMSFAVQHVPRGLEYCGSSLNHLFAQRRNLLRPSFYRMLLQIDRFNHEAVAALSDPNLSALSLDDYVRQRGYGEDFLQLYLLPMSSAVWSTPPRLMRQFPAATLLRFFHNHGFLGLHTQHPWWTVDGGAQQYVTRLTQPFRSCIHLRTPVRAVRKLGGKGVEVVTDRSTGRFDKVVFACHAPAALALLGSGATAEERRLLGAFRYQPNSVSLHTCPAVMPRKRMAWSSWNYRLDSPESGACSGEPLRVSTHYWMNRLQGVSQKRDYFVSIEGEHLLSPDAILGRYNEEHPLFDLSAAQAQPLLPGLNRAAQGTTETYFVGAWQRYGFHEDGLLSAHELAALLLGSDPWAESFPTGRNR
jgi:predicted NAD/FAD-binding protein